MALGSCSESLEHHPRHTVTPPITRKSTRPLCATAIERARHEGGQEPPVLPSGWLPNRYRA